MCRDLKAIEGREFTLRAQKNSQDSVRITDEGHYQPLFARSMPVSAVSSGKRFLRISRRTWQDAREHSGRIKPDTDSIKEAILHEEQVPGAELRRGWHLRIK